MPCCPLAHEGKVFMQQQRIVRGSGFYRGRQKGRERMLLAVTGGLAFSMLAVLFVVLLSKPGEASAPPSIESLEDEYELRQARLVTLLALERPVPPGTALEGAGVSEVQWSSVDVPPGAITTRRELRGKYAKSEIPAGIPITPNRLTDRPFEATLNIHPGYRAVSIDADATSIIEGHAQPGSRVDLLLTYSRDDKPTTVPIVQNVVVLSLGGETERRHTAGSRRGAETKTVTLEVAASDAPKVQTARSLGRLSLVMRAFGDTRSIPVSESTANDISGDKPVAVAKESCGGTIRVAGTDYIVSCNGGRLVALH